MTTLHSYYSVDASSEAKHAYIQSTKYAIAEHTTRLLFVAASIAIISFAAFHAPLFGVIAFFAVLKLAPEFQNKIREPLRNKKNEHALTHHLWKKTLEHQARLSGTAALQTEATRLNIDNDEELVPVIARYCAIEDEVIVAQTKKEDLEKLDFDNDAARALNAFEIYRIEESDDLDLKRTGILKGNLEKAFLLHILKNKNDQRMMNAFGQAHILPRYVRDGVKNQTFFQLTNDALVERSEFMDGSVDKITELAAKIFSSPVDGTDDGTGTGDS